MRLLSARSLVLLGLLAAALLTQLDAVLVSAALLPFVFTLLAAQLDRAGARLAHDLVDLCVRLLPAERRADERDAWIDHIECAQEAGLEPLTRALTIALIAAPALAVGMRVGRRRRAGN
jgi:hypothetical protein